MTNCKYYQPEPDNPYPLCLGIKDSDKFKENGCEDCCLYLWYEKKHDPWEGYD